MGEISLLYSTQLEAEAVVADNYWRGFRHGVGFTVVIALVLCLGRPSPALLSGLKAARVS
jgi:hypothetical protein